MKPIVTIASVTVGSVPPRPSAAGPGVEPALCGPTCGTPRSDTQPIEPPPAPTEITSTMLTPVWNGPRSRFLSMWISFSEMIPVSKLVPPMSPSRTV